MISKKLFYESPSAETVTIHPEGMICESDPWYEKGGEGNFNFGIEDDPLFG